jgi:hypothetical protein
LRTGKAVTGRQRGLKGLNLCFNASWFHTLVKLCHNFHIQIVFLPLLFELSGIPVNGVLRCTEKEIAKIGSFFGSMHDIAGGLNNF